MSHNKIQNSDPQDLPPSLVVLKLMGNPCANDENYRKSHVLALPELEELDTIEVSAPEKLHYQGLVKVPLDKILKH